MSDEDRPRSVRITGVLRALSGLSQREFAERWIEDHVPRLSMAFPNLTGLRCNVSLQNTPGEQVFDGTQDMWWDSVEAMQASLASRHRAEASDNVRTFSVPLDLAWIQEHVLLPVPQSVVSGSPVQTPGVKVVALLQAKPHLKSVIDIEKHWVREHLERMTMKLERIRGLSAAIATPERLRRQPFDAIEDLWWGSLEDFEADKASPEGRAAHLSSAELMWSTDLVVQEYVFL